MEEDGGQHRPSWPQEWRRSVAPCCRAVLRSSPAPRKGHALGKKFL